MNTMLSSSWNPQCKMRRDQPHALIGRDLHNATDRVDQLIRPVRVLRHLKARRVFMGEGRNGYAPLWIELCQSVFLSH